MAMRQCGLAFLFSALLLQQAASERGRFVEEDPPAVTTHNVHILVTRHALSWANIAHDWINTYYHARMKDPLLTQVGLRKSSDISKEVKKWIDKRNWKIDGVISSTLVRAIETALLQYPGHEVAVAPFIAETGFGADNEPREVKDQAEKLMEHLANRSRPEGYRVNYHWREALADLGGKSSWSRFLNFLEDFFLPQLLKKREAQGIPASKPIVLAVVTHSNFMGEGDIAERCSSLYSTNQKGKSKPRNNQVFHLGYKLDSSASETWDVTTRLSMAPDGKCEMVHEGVVNQAGDGNLHELCESDIGEDAVAYIQEKTGYRPETIDDQLQKKYEKISEKIDKYLRSTIGKGKAKAERQQKAQEIVKMIAELRQERKNTECWAGGNPKDPEATNPALEFMNLNTLDF